MREANNQLVALRRLLGRLSVPLSLRVTLSAFAGSLVLGLGLIAWAILALARSFSGGAVAAAG